MLLLDQDEEELIMLNDDFLHASLEEDRDEDVDVVYVETLLLLFFVICFCFSTSISSCSDGDSLHFLSLSFSFSSSSFSSMMFFSLDDVDIFEGVVLCHRVEEGVISPLELILLSGTYVERLYVVLTRGRSILYAHKYVEEAVEDLPCI